MTKLRTFVSLSPEELAATVEAFALLAYATVKVAKVPPRRWRTDFGVTGTADVCLPSARERSCAALVRCAVGRAARNMPTSPNCLPQALAARTMLKRRGVPAVLSIGAERGERTDRQFHAWLKVGNLFVTGDCDEARYARFALPCETCPTPPCEASAALASQATE